jgi:hypothetical protein
MPFASTTLRNNSRSASPSGSQEGRANHSGSPRRGGFGGFVENAPPPAIVNVTPTDSGILMPTISSIMSKINVFDQSTNSGTCVANIIDFLRLFIEQATFGAPEKKVPRPQPVTVSMNSRPEAKTTQQGSLAITDGSMMGEEGAVVPISLNNNNNDKKHSKSSSSSKKKKSKSKRKVDKHNAFKAPTAESGASKMAHAVSSGLTELVTSKISAEIPDNATLAQQENLEIRGNDARHLLMHKLMRVNRSCVIVLKNMVSASELDDELESEVREECGKFGKVDEVNTYH